MHKCSSIVSRVLLILLIISTAQPCGAVLSAHQNVFTESEEFELAGNGQDAGYPGNMELLDYGDVVSDSILYSASLSVKKQDVYISNAEYKSNYAGLYPAVSLGGRSERYENLDHRNSSGINVIGNEVIGGSQNLWKASMSLSGQYYISHWYKKRYEAKYYEKLRDSSIYECEAEEKKIIREVTDIFRSVAEGKLKLKYANEILARQNEISRLKKEASAIGQFSYEEVLKAEAEALGIRKDITAINKEIRENLESLGNYTGKSYPEDIEVVPLPFNSELSFDDETGIVAWTPEYKARRKELEAVRFKEKSTGNNYLPDVSLYGKYDFYNSSPNSMDDSLKDVRPTDYSVGLYISLPLFDGGVRDWERKKTLHELKKAKESARLVFNEKNKDIRMLQAGLTELSKSYANYRKLDEQYKKIIDINKKSRLLGERSRLDIIELERDALNVERDLKIIEQTIGVYKKQLALELNFNEFAGDYGGNRTCKH